MNNKKPNKGIRLYSKCFNCHHYNAFACCCELWDKPVKDKGKCDYFKKERDNG